MATNGSAFGPLTSTGNYLPRHREIALLPSVDDHVILMNVATIATSTTSPTTTTHQDMISM